MRTRFGIITLFLVLVIAFSLKGVAMSKENNGRAEANRYYAALEKEFLKQAKQTLEEQGYSNCGVTMTRVTNEDGSREYTVLLHHRKFEWLRQADRDSLTDMLAAKGFTDGVCTFVVSICP